MTKVIFSQIGAREYFANPLALLRKNILYKMLTDFWLNQKTLTFLAIRFMNVFSGRTGVLLTKRNSDIPQSYVEAFNPLFLRFQIGKLLPSAGKRSKNLYSSFIEYNQRYNQEILRWVQNENHLNQFAIFWGYNSECLEIFRFLKNHGKKLVLSQVDPGPQEAEIVKAEMHLWPNWSAMEFPIPENYFSRIREEWDLADIIVVNSEWSRKCLIEEKVHPQKIRVVPLAFSPAASSYTPRNYRCENLTVLFLGDVSLRKGIPYLIAAAKVLEKRNIEFLVAGPLKISESIVANAPKNMRFLGKIPRSKISNFFSQGHIYCLPTVSDGFAITQLEAMSHSLPVICSPYAGTVVEDGKDGFIVDPRNVDAIAASIEKFFADRALLEEMSRNAFRKSQKFSLEVLAKNLEFLSELSK